MIPSRLACSKSKGEKSTHGETAVSISVAKCYGLSVVGLPDIGRQACMCQPSASVFCKHRSGLSWAPHLEAKSLWPGTWANSLHEWMSWPTGNLSLAQCPWLGVWAQEVRQMGNKAMGFSQAGVSTSSRAIADFIDDVLIHLSGHSSFGERSVLAT